uniref:Ig-like domain-containing protein n=1 Tax=Callorhinchus milii TaxID=7868 RepID=A0A4W3GJ19_CALMI
MWSATHCMFKLIFISRFFSGLSRGDYVTHWVPSVTETEGGQVTLDSNYTTTLSDYCLYWYRQLSEKQPEYILSSCTVLSEHKAAFAQSRFSVELQTSSTSNKLTISQLEVSDSAVYYCALSTHSDGCQRPPRTKALLALCGGIGCLHIRKTFDLILIIFGFAVAPYHHYETTQNASQNLL